MSDSLVATATSPVEEGAGKSTNYIALVVVVAVIGGSFIIGISITLYRCLKSGRSRRLPERSSVERHILPRTVTHHRHDPILSAQIVYIHDARSLRESHDGLIVPHQAILVDDVAGVNAMSWAQRMMSGDGVEKSHGSVHETTPVEEAIYVEQPDGRHILAVSHRFRDSMVQVRPEDLGLRVPGSSRLERSSSVGPSVSIAPTTHGIVPLYGTFSRHTDMHDNPGKKKKRRRKGVTKYDAWCQANLDMRNL